jgi:hypothetical protein
MLFILHIKKHAKALSKVDYSRGWLFDGILGHKGIFKSLLVLPRKNLLLQDNVLD